MNRLADAWSDFWFSPGLASRLVPIRLSLCAVIAIWFVSFWASVPVWFGENGVLATELAAKLIAFEELAGWEYWSPLWWTDSVQLPYVWILGGAMLAVLVAFGVGGRWTVGLLIAWMIAWAHRIVWLTSTVEPAVIAFAAYLIVEPGPNLRNWLARRADSQVENWQSTFAIRLIQTHWWILLAATLLSQLADIVWWRGEAVWWLVSAGRSTLLSVENLRDRPALVNVLTHAFIAIEMLALWLVVTRGGRPLGLAFGWLSCLAIALIADQQLYGALLGCALLAFVEWPIRSDSGASRR